jgi:hypothetical protein
VTYLIKYLSKFEFILETILDYESGDQIGSFDAKDRYRKSHAWAPLTRYGAGAGVGNNTVIDQTSFRTKAMSSSLV